MTEPPTVPVGSVAKSISETHARNKDHLVFLNTSDVLLGKALHRDYSPTASWPGQAKKSIKKNDILFSEIRPANGRWAFIDFDACDFVVSTKLMVIRADTSKILPRFLYHFLTSRKTTSWLQHLAESRSGTFPQITFDQIAELKISLPELSAQEAITSLLDALEDKIDLNRRINETLKLMARAVFKDWFVDFGPTRSKMEGHKAYLAPEIWALFPDRFDDESKPAGWNYIPLAAASSEIRRGISPTYTQHGGICVLNQKCIRSREVDFGPARRHDLSKRSIDGRQLSVGDVLINSTGVGTLGRVAQLWDLDQPVVADSHVTVVRPKAEVISAYYLGLDLTGRETEIEAMGEGSTGQTELSRTRLGSLSLIQPAKDIQIAFDAAIEPLIKRMSANRGEQRLLAETRDLLIPKLMSGEILVADAKKITDIAA